jgi:hypothetical protein
MLVSIWCAVDVPNRGTETVYDADAEGIEKDTGSRTIEACEVSSEAMGLLTMLVSSPD